MSYRGGTNNAGTIFRIDKDGSGFILLHSFTGSAYSGGYPYGSLIIDGTNLFGMSYADGTNNGGTIFRIGKDGGGFTMLYSFATSATDGRSPQGSLILHGSHLYGMTGHGGTNDAGTIFRIGIDGSDYSLLQNFNFSNTDGAIPRGSLIDDGTYLYGMTSAGGTDGYGTIFSLANVGLAVKESPYTFSIEKFTLMPAYPNPFNPSTIINYSLPIESGVTISIFDMLGRKVHELISQKQSVGSYSVQWNGTDSQGNMVSAGIYFYQIQAGAFVQTKKMLLLR